MMSGGFIDVSERNLSVFKQSVRRQTPGTGGRVVELITTLHGYEDKV